MLFYVLKRVIKVILAGDQVFSVYVIDKTAGRQLKAIPNILIIKCKLEIEFALARLTAKPTPFSEQFLDNWIAYL